jgi:pimeloyl-ACP methyl ester carboxylesterase
VNDLWERSTAGAGRGEAVGRGDGIAPDPTAGLPLDPLADLVAREDRARTDDGAELHIVVAGNRRAQAPQIVLAHCWTGDSRVWGPVARRLVADGHEVVLYDHRGHGRSTTGSVPLTLEALADDLALVLDHTGVCSAVVAGHSMGGMVVQAFAGRHRHEIGRRVGAAVLASTASRPVLRGLRRRLGPAVVGHRRVAALLGRPRVGPRTVRDFVGRPRHTSHLRAVTETFRATPGPVRSQLLQAMCSMDLSSGLAALGAVPVTVVVGEEDRHTPVAQAVRITSALPHARLVVEPGVGHMLPFESPDLLARLIAQSAAANERTPS